MARTHESVKLVTFIPAQDIEDAPVFTDKDELLAEIKQIESQGNMVVAYDEHGDEIPLWASVLLLEPVYDDKEVSHE
jgi:hypothetical protein